MRLLFTALLPKPLLGHNEQRVTCVRIPAAVFGGISVKGEGQCFPKVSDLKNSQEPLLKTDSQALALEIQKPGVEPWNLPFKQQPQVASLPLFPEPAMTFLQNPWALCPPPRFCRHPSEGHLSACAGWALPPREDMLDSQVCPHHLHPQPAPSYGQVRWWGERHYPVFWE